MAPDPIDWSIALQAVEGQRTFLAELIEIFFTECPALQEEIRSALARGDAKTLHRAAHTLKGGLRYFGPSHAGDLAQQLELLGRQGQLDSVPVVFAELQQATAELMPHLQAFVVETQATDEL